jgi:hypothetical protein
MAIFKRRLNIICIHETYDRHHSPTLAVLFARHRRREVAGWWGRSISFPPCAAGRVGHYGGFDDAASPGACEPFAYRDHRNIRLLP